MTVTVSRATRRRRSARTCVMPGKRFGEELAEILYERQMSQRELSRLTRANGWGSHATVARLVDGELPPTFRAVEEISKALHVKPERFAEYRLMVARRLLDPAAVGVEEALRNLGEND